VRSEPDPFPKFEAVCRALSGTFSQCALLYNSRAEHQVWQARYFAIINSTACFIDVIEARVSTKPPKIVIHNRAWGEGVPKGAHQSILDVAKTSGVLFQEEI